MNDIKWNMTLASLGKRFSDKNVINKDSEIITAEDYRKKLI